MLGGWNYEQSEVGLNTILSDLKTEQTTNLHTQINHITGHFTSLHRWSKNIPFASIVFPCNEHVCSFCHPDLSPTSKWEHCCKVPLSAEYYRPGPSCPRSLCRLLSKKTCRLLLSTELAPPENVCTVCDMLTLIGPHSLRAGTVTRTLFTRLAG